jgi:hypothetical protein
MQWRYSNYSDATNIGEVPLPKLQTSRGFVALFEKIYEGEPIITVISNIEKDVQYRCFNQVYDVKILSQTDTVPLFESNYRFQMTETGFAEKF